MKIKTLKSKAILGVLVVVILGVGYYCIQRDKTKTLQVLKDTFIVEYGTRISTNCNTYLDFTNIEVEKQEDIKKEAKFSIDKDIEKEYPDIGEYEATIVYQQEQVDFKILVKDTIPPSIAPVEDEVVEIGTKVSSEQVKSKFMVTDLQEVKVEIEDDTYDTSKVGKYMIKAIVRDASGNVAKASYYLIVKEKNEVPVYKKPPTSTTPPKEEGINKPDKEVEWWASLSDLEIRDTVISSLVWKNEWSNAMYYGIQGVTYGFNVENKAYGGLLLVKNPYNVQMDFGFYGGPYCQTDATTFSLYWQAPKGPGREVSCGKMSIAIPKAITGEELYNYYQ